MRLYTRLHGLFDPLIREQKVGLRNMKGVVNAQKLIDWLLAEGDIIKREEGVALGEHLFASGILRHGELPTSVILATPHSLIPSQLLMTTTFEILLTCTALWQMMVMKVTGSRGGPQPCHVWSSQLSSPSHVSPSP